MYIHNYICNCYKRPSSLLAPNASSEQLKKKHFLVWRYKQREGSHTELCTVHFAGSDAEGRVDEYCERVPVIALAAHRANGEHVQKPACTTTKKLITICWHEPEHNFSGSVMIAAVLGSKSQQHLQLSKYCTINIISQGQTSIGCKVLEMRVYIQICFKSRLQFASTVSNVLRL